MKRIVSLLLLIALVMALAACGASEPDPNAGVYEAKTADYAGISVSIDTVFPTAFRLNSKTAEKRPSISRARTMA